MNAAQRNELVNYKLDRAWNTLKEIEVQLNHNLFYTAVNRLYYACFYAVSALLVNSQIQAKKHSGVKQMFGLHFVSTGKISVQSGAFYSNIFDKRQKGDYEDFIYFSEEEIKFWASLATILIEEIQELLIKENKDYTKSL